MPGSRRALARWVVLVATVTSCDQPTDPLPSPERRLIVHAVLDAASPWQDVLVQYIDGTFGHRIVNLGGAEVTITTPDGALFTAVERDDGDFGFHYHVADLGAGQTTQIVPGGTYTLSVRTSLGEEVRGTTTVPQFTSAPLVDTIAAFVRLRDTLTLSWSRVAGAARYEVAIQAFHRAGTSAFFDLTYRTFADTSITLSGTARTLENDEVFPLADALFVVVSAADANYYDYYHLNVDPFAGASPSKLTGALGVFGSIARVRSRRYESVD